MLVGVEWVSDRSVWPNMAYRGQSELTRSTGILVSSHGNQPERREHPCGLSVSQCPESARYPFAVRQPISNVPA